MPRGRRLWTRAWPVILLWGCGGDWLPAAEQFWLYTRPLIIPERGAVTGYVLQTEQARYSFLPPADWVVEENVAAREVVMMAPSLTTSIRFKIVPTQPESPEGPGSAPWRKAILEQYPGARLVAEFPCYTGSGAGTAFDLERTAVNRLKISTRLAVVPLSGGRVEFNLTTPAGELPDFHPAFGNLLTSFTAESVRTNQTRTNLVDTPRKHPTRRKGSETRGATSDRGGGASGNAGVKDLCSAIAMFYP